MSSKHVKILVVEDDPADVRLIQERLGPKRSQRYIMEDVGYLDAGLSLLADQSFDAVLLDLNLPDANGVETLEQVRKVAPEVPVIVLTTGDFDGEPVDLIRSGAQDYLLKDELETAILQRSIDYSIERNRLMLNVTELQREAARQRALNDLERISGLRTTDTTAESFGDTSLHTADSQLFDFLTEEYVALLKDALERRAYREVPALESRVRGIASRLGSLRASPRDVVDIHTAAYRLEIGHATRQRKDAINAEAPMLLIEVMGYLALYYRTFMGPAPHRTRTRNDDGNG